MKTIFFTNSLKKKITDDTANIIKRNIIKGCNPFQCFLDEKGDGLMFMINLNEVVSIE